jgi:hypothetical protein
MHPNFLVCVLKKVGRVFKKTHYLVKSINDEAPHYVVCSSVVTFSFLGPNILLSSLFSKHEQGKFFP